MKLHIPHWPGALDSWNFRRERGRKIIVTTPKIVRALVINISKAKYVKRSNSEWRRLSEATTTMWNVWNSWHNAHTRHYKYSTHMRNKTVPLSHRRNESKLSKKKRINIGPIPNSVELSEMCMWIEKKNTIQQHSRLNLCLRSLFWLFCCRFIVYLSSI